MTMLSRPPLAIPLPSGLNATLVTERVWALRVRVSSPLVASQSFTVLSLLPLAIRLPSG